MEFAKRNSLDCFRFIKSTTWFGVLMLLVGNLQSQEWELVQTPISNAGGYMNNMHFINKNIGWIVGTSDAGDILHTTDGGRNWSVQ